MKKIYSIGLDVHKDSIAVVIAPSDSTEIRKYGVIGGTLDALDKLIKKLAQAPTLRAATPQCSPNSQSRSGQCYLISLGVIRVAFF